MIHVLRKALARVHHLRYLGLCLIMEARLRDKT